MPFFNIFYFLFVNQINVVHLLYICIQKILNYISGVLYILLDLCYGLVIFLDVNSKATSSSFGVIYMCIFTYLSNFQLVCVVSLIDLFILHCSVTTAVVGILLLCFVSYLLLAACYLYFFPLVCCFKLVLVKWFSGKKQ